MMIKDGGRAVKKGGEKILGTLGFLLESAAWALNTVLPSWARVRPIKRNAIEPAGRATGRIPTGSPLDHVGPVPKELRMDPFARDSVPWSIQEAEKERGRARVTMILGVSVAICWLITAVAVLRSLGIF